MEQNLELLKNFQFDAKMFYKSIVSSTDDYIFIIDMTKDIALVSENMYQDFDLSGRLIEGIIPEWGKLVHNRDKKRYYDAIAMMLDGLTDKHNLEYQVKNRKNEYIWITCRGLLTRDDQGIAIFFVGIVTLTGSKGKLDHTTGLLTQEECRKNIDQYLDQNYQKGGFLLLGIDDFKRINSVKNHIFGDYVLRKMAQDIQQILPDKASMYRFDGDEFAIFLPQATTEDMKEIYQKIHLYANREHEVDRTSFICTVSGGIAILGNDADNYLDLIKCVMSALEHSKKSGKNMVSIFTENMLLSHVRDMKIINQLQHCILNQMEGFSMVYQPFVDSGTLQIKGAEALLRWSSPTDGNISPVEFIPLLESCGSIIQVGKWVLEQAVLTCQQWTTLYPHFVMNINVSYLQLIEEDFVSDIESLLSKYDLSPKHIVLEMTESYFVTDINALRNTFYDLRGLGIHIAMDDFGTGYSSMGMLSQTPADIVKIDRIFINMIHDQTHEFNRTFIKAVIKLCHNVGISVCVEGVETEEELRIVQNMGADSIQGFYISKPMQKDQFDDHFVNRECCSI